MLEDDDCHCPLLRPRTDSTRTEGLNNAAMRLPTTRANQGGLRYAPSAMCYAPSWTGGCQVRSSTGLAWRACTVGRSLAVPLLWRSAGVAHDGGEDGCQGPLVSPQGRS